MLLKRKFEIFLLLVFFLLSFWLMNKSFGYDPSKNEFRIARHEVGDFGLHLSLIRSFSWGSNIPVESPFFPGKPLPYHYYFDLLVGLLEKIGLRIDVAFNGLSIFFFTALLFLIYKIPQLIFNKSKLLGITSVILFVFHSSLTFLDFIKDKKLNLSLINDFWRLPDYIHKGPFDNSLISIFFTLNVFLNQRHLIAGLAISLFIFYFVIKNINKNLNSTALIVLGLILGLSSRFHTLIFLSTSVTLFFLLLLFKRSRFMLFIFVPALLVFAFHARDILNQNLTHTFFSPGFLAEQPLTLLSFSKFWLLNLGLAVVFIPLGFLISNSNQRKIFLSFFPLFIFGNLFQVSFRIDHNHSIFNFFLIFANFYVSFLLFNIWNKKLLGKIFFLFFLFLLTFSGLIDLMAVKNDFQLRLKDAPSDKFIFWIKENTSRNAIFLSKEGILDPITLSGRKNYMGHRYYISVMGYNFAGREEKVKKFYEVSNIKTLEEMKKEGISYIVVPVNKIQDFSYSVNTTFLKDNIPLIYIDKNVLVFKL
ncbi:hypothetical protein C4559_03380 [Candidatus Microgenomates bacterium]|nr:MAG: hypothetical protein C4559_03380 [Candidatus Microgenomates bacterium]